MIYDYNKNGFPTDLNKTLDEGDIDTQKLKGFENGNNHWGFKLTTEEAYIFSQEVAKTTAEKAAEKRK